MAHKPRRDRRRTSHTVGPDETVAMSSEPFESDRPIGIETKTAAIGAVTSEMMDEAAHKAADAVAATAHQAAVHATPAIVDATVEPNRSESQVAVGEPGPRISPDLGSSPTEIEAPAMPPGGDVETGYDRAPPLMHASEPDAAATVKEPVSIAAGAVAGQETPVVFQGDTVSFPDLPTRSTETLDGTEETPQPRVPPFGGPISLINAQVIEMLASNMAATGQFLTALMGAKTVTEVMAVNAHHLRQQMELMTAQGRQMTALTRTIATDAMKPFGPSASHQVRDR